MLRARKSHDNGQVARTVLCASLGAPSRRTPAVALPVRFIRPIRPIRPPQYCYGGRVRHISVFLVSLPNAPDFGNLFTPIYAHLLLITPFGPPGGTFHFWVVCLHAFRFPAPSSFPHPCLSVSIRG